MTFNSSLKIELLLLSEFSISNELYFSTISMEKKEKSEMSLHTY